MGIPRWVEDRDFDLDRHLRRAWLSPPADDAQLQALVSRLMSQPLDRHHPLWVRHRAGLRHLASAGSACDR
jgi:hypothetical protein